MGKVRQEDTGKKATTKSAKKKVPRNPNTVKGGVQKGNILGETRKGLSQGVENHLRNARSIAGGGRGPREGRKRKK